MTDEIDLTTCDREPIHLLGAIQKFGFLLALSPDWIVLRASENVRDYFGKGVNDVVGRPLSDFFALDAIEAVRVRLRHLLVQGAAERVMRVALINGGQPFDLAIHLSGNAIVIEAEPSDPDVEPIADIVRNMSARLHGARDLATLCDEASRNMRTLTGFDRVMVYRFGPDGAGQVIAEAKRDDVPGYLGLHYPASDIPVQARALYERNWLRIIADVTDDGVAILPQRGADGAPLDLSMSVLRAVSPIHLEYLRNMGVGASLSVSILRQGKLWGLFACHHMVPRKLPLSTRTAAELFGQMFSWILESFEHRSEIEAERRAREIHDRLMTGFAQENGIESIANEAHRLRHVVDCDGVVIWIDGKPTIAGITPRAEELIGLVRFLNTTSPSRVFSTDEIGKAYEPGGDFVDRAAGLLSIPISRAPRDYIIFFRREHIRKVDWAGDPAKPATLGPSGVRLTPRKSFELWQETIRGRAIPWASQDVRVAEHLRVTLIEIILRMSGIAAEERRQAEARQDLLIAELNHRVRNILALVRGLVSQSSQQTGDAAALTEMIGGRLSALARAHDQINRNDWRPGDLRELIIAELDAYAGMGRDLATLDGVDILVEPKAFSALALVVHEMATNAAKYGALSVPEGRLSISWHVHENGLALAWRESGGPPVKPPSRRGFGTTVITRSIPFELKGEAKINYLLTGVTGDFFIPAQFIRKPVVDTASHDGRSSSKTSNASQEAELGGTALLVEDNLMIALDGESMLQELGFEKILIAATLDQAQSFIETADIDVAVLDYDLGGQTASPLGAMLAARGIPFVYATGYGEGLLLSGEIGNAELVHKPYSLASLRYALVTAKRQHAKVRTSSRPQG